MGSLAISLCHLAAGRVDGVCSLKPARSVDIAAAQLLVREAGLAIDLFEAPPFGAAPLDLDRTFARRRGGNARAVRAARSRPVRIGCSGWNYAQLARRRLLPAALSAAALARVLRAAVRHGRGERDLLPAADREALSQGWVDADARRLPLRGQGEPLPDAHQAADRARPRARALLRADRAARRSPKLGPVLWQLPPTFQRDDERLARALERLPPGQPRLRVPARELVRGGRLRPAPRARRRARPRRRRSAALRGRPADDRLDLSSASTTALAAAAATTPSASSPSGRSASRRSKGRRTSTSTTTGRASRSGTRCASRSSLEATL